SAGGHAHVLRRDDGSRTAVPLGTGQHPHLPANCEQSRAGWRQRHRRTLSEAVTPGHGSPEGYVMHWLHRWVALVSIAMLAGFASVRADIRPAIADSGKTALSRSLAASVDRGDVPGVVAVVVDADSVLYQGAAGKQDVARRVEMKPDAIFRIASMTKPVTTVALMMLVEGGRLSLEDPVSKYLPS